MAQNISTGGRPKGDTQGHEHEKLSRDYRFASGGTTQSIPNKSAAPGAKAATRGYSAECGGGTVS